MNIERPVLFLHPPFGYSPNDISTYYMHAGKDLGLDVKNFYLNRQATYHSLAMDYAVKLGMLKQAPKMGDIMTVIKNNLLGSLFSLRPAKLITVHGFYFSNLILQELRAMCDIIDCELILITTESPHAESDEIDASKYFHKVYCTDRSALRYIPNAKYIGHSFNNKAHTPQNLYHIPEEYIKDLGFVGSYFKERIDILEQIIARGFSCYLAGVIDDSMMGSEFVKYVNPEVVDNAELSKLYSGATFSLNTIRKSIDLYSEAPHKIQESMTIRMIEIMASGGVLVTDPVEELRELCEDGVHYIEYNSVDELISKLEFYKNNPELVAKIRSNAYTHIRKIKNSYLSNLKLILDD